MPLRLALALQRKAWYVALIVAVPAFTIATGKICSGRDQIQDQCGNQNQADDQCGVREQDTDLVSLLQGSKVASKTSSREVTNMREIENFLEELDDELDADDTGDRRDARPLSKSAKSSKPKTWQPPASGYVRYSPSSSAPREVTLVQHYRVLSRHLAGSGIVWIIPVVAIVLILLMCYLLGVMSSSKRRFETEDPFLRRSEIAKPQPIVIPQSPAVPRSSYPGSPVASSYAGSPVVHRRLLAPPGQMPPPICPSLVLQFSESRYNVRLSDLATLGTAGTCGIFSLKGDTLLHASVHRGVRLDLSLVGSQHPRCSVLVPASGGEDFKIFAAGDRIWGFLRKISDTGYDIVHHGRTILTVDCEELAASRLVVLGTDAQAVALAQVNVQDFPSGDHFEIRALSNTDTALILTVILAIMLFCAP